MNPDNNWKPFDWQLSLSFFSSTTQGRHVLEEYEKAKKAEEERNIRKAKEEAENKRRKQEETSRIEEIRRQDRERSRRNAEYYRRRNEENQETWRKAEEIRQEDIKKLKEETAAQREKDFQDWVGTDYYKDNFFFARYFDLKNMLGQAVISSIDTNGNTIQGKMSLNELRKQAADAHKQLVQLQDNIKSIEEQRALFDETYAMDPEYMNANRTDPKVIDFWQKRAEYDKAIQDIQAKMQDFQLQGLNDAYKLFFVYDKKGFWNTALGMIGDAFKDAITYDEAMPELRAKRKQEREEEYNKLIGEEQIKYNDRNGLVNTDLSQQEVRSADEMIERANNENEELQQEYIQNRTHLKNSLDFWDVAESFKMGQQSHSTDALYNPYYYLYQVAPMVGSSMSSPSQAIGNVIKGGSMIAGAALAPFSEGASLGLMMLGEAAATPFEAQGGFDENYGEIGEKRIETIMNLLQDKMFTGDADIQEYTFGDGKVMRFDDPRFPNYLKKEHKTTYLTVIDELKDRSRKFWKERGWKEEWINDYLDGDEGDRHALLDYISGVTSGRYADKDGNPMFGEFMHPAFLNSEIQSTAGLYAQFQANNVRTMGELPVQKLITLLPPKWIKNGLGFVDQSTSKLGSKVASKIERDAAGRVTARAEESVAGTGARKAVQTKYANGFRRDERTFTQAVGSGYEKGSAVGDALGFGYAGHTIGGVIGGTTEGFAHAARQVLNPNLRAAFDGLEEKLLIKYQTALDKLTPEKAWQQALLKYGMRSAKRNIALGFSEGAEEAVQYLNSKEDFASKYGWAGMSLSDMIANDLKQGGRVLDAYMSLFGLSNSELRDDEEYWSNLKGGFILGGLPVANPSGMIQVAGNTIHGYKEYKTHDAMISSGVMNREYDKINRASNAEMARLAFNNNEQHVIEAINKMEAADRRRENPFFTQEDYDEKRKAAQSVMGMAKNKKIREMLEAKGIRYGTDKYAHAIADLYSIDSNLRENENQSNEVRSKLLQIYESEAFNTIAGQTVDRILSDEMSGEKDALERYIKEAGDKAVVKEIDAIREELQLDPQSKKYAKTINRPEYKLRIESARQQAEDFVRKSLTEGLLDTVKEKSTLVNRLHALISMRARHNTIDDFYNFLTDKFNLRPVRQDAKTIRDNVDAQIKQAKRQLAELTKGTSNEFDQNSSDADALKYLEEAESIVRYKEDSVQDLEVANAMLSADRAVSQSYWNQFTEGLVEKNGKWEYNPEQYKANKKHQVKANLLLLQGKVDEYEALNQAGPELIEHKPENATDNKYSRRIDAIMQANERNAAIDWAINEVYNGDAVNKLNEVFAEEARKERSKQERQDRTDSVLERQESDPFEPSEQSNTEQLQQVQQPEQTKWESTLLKRESAFQKNREKYESRKKKAKETYERNKKRYKNWKRSNLNSTVIPFQDAIVKAANALMYAAKDGAYKFAQLVEDFKEIAEDINVKDALPILKRAYNKRYAYYTLKDATVLDNMSTPEEVASYGVELTTLNVQPEPASIPLHLKMQEQFDNDAKNIVTELSSHYDIIVDDGATAQIYTNEEAISHSKNGKENRTIEEIYSKLRNANTSDELFKQAIIELTLSILDFPIDQYVKYREVEGIEYAIARRFMSWSKNQYITNGIKTRKAVISILLGKPLNEQEYPAGFDKFKEDILKLKENLTGESGLGLTILNTEQYIYGLDNNGKRVFSEADIIAADESGKIYVIDVRSGYTNIRPRFHAQVSSAIGFTIEDQVKDQLKQINQIINNKFKIPVKLSYCLPVVFNEYGEGIAVEKDENGRALIAIDINTKSERSYSTDVNQQKKNAKKLIDTINDQIDEYNSLVEEGSKYSSEHSKMERLTLEEYATANEYDTYFNHLHAKYDDMLSKIDNLILSILNDIDRYNNIWLENIKSANQELVHHEPNEYVLLLMEACKELDITLQYVPQLKATTVAEKQNIQKLYQTIYDALKALDELLQNADASMIDVTAEEELIASAMEILAENKENFGEMSVFMRKWWADNFVIGRGNNTEQGVKSIAELYYGFVNTINSWTSTLANHAINYLDNNEVLQEWYSSILNRYFAKLIDNAELFANNQEDAIKQSLQPVIDRGRQFIAAFNEAWGTLPDEDFPGPPANEAERINRLPVKWKDLYGSSTSHSPAFDAMAKSVIYYVMSNSPSFVQNYLTQSSLAEDQENKATRFTLFEDKRGEIKLRINWWNGSQWKYEELPFIIDLNNYPNASQEDINRFVTVNRANKKFVRKVKQMLDYVKNNPDYTIEFTVSADKGSINYDKTGITHHVSEFLFNNEANKHDLYTISLSEKDRLGIGVFVIDRTNGTKFYSVRAGSDLSTRIGGFDERFFKLHLNTLNGALIYFYDYGDGTTIGVPILSQLIGIDSATKLVDLIQRYVSGERKYQGYDILNLLKQRLYMSDPTRVLSKYNNVTNMVTIKNNGDVIIGNQVYNVVQNRAVLTQRIAQMSNSVVAEYLNENMYSSDDQVLQEIRNQFIRNNTLDKVTLPNGFTISREDFVHKNSDGTQGSTWLGYLIRNGFLGTRATSKSYRQVNIDNLHLVNKNDITRTEAKQIEDRANARKNRISALSQIDDPFATAKGGLSMTVDENSIEETRGVEEQEDFVNAVKEYFKKVFGTDSDVIFEDAKKTFIKEAAKNQRVIGLCTSEMVKLSRYAPYSAMYHEAFHKIMELVLPSKQREEFYNIYRSKNGKHLSDREVAEGLADLFVDYMMKRVLPKNAKWYNKIFRWFKSAGFAMNMAWNYGIVNTRKMYTTYHNMNNGVYANLEISEENAERFRKQFDSELYYTVNGINLLHIADSGQLQEMVKALGYYILESYGIDQINPEINIKIDSNTPNRISKEILDDLTKEGVPVENLTAVDLAFREILKKGNKVPIIATSGKNKGKTIGYEYEYPNFAAIKKNISDYISGIIGSDFRVIEETEDSESSEVQSMNMERYDRAAFEFSKLDGVTKKVKLFFATIPYCTFDADGRIIEDYSRNIYECPTYMPLKEVYNIIVNECKDAKDIQDLDNKLFKFAMHKPVFRMVYMKYHKLISEMYTYDSENNITKIDYDKEAFAIQILNAVRSQKHDFIVALSKNLGNEGKEINIVSSNLDRDSRRFPQQWTQFLLSGQVSVFNRNRDANGNLVFKEGMGGSNGTDIFSRTAKFISDLRLALSNVNDQFTIDGKTFNKDSLNNVEEIKNELLKRLHTVGIIFSKDALDHMLVTEYGDMGATGLLDWLTLTGKTSINTFLERLNDFVSKQGVPNKDVLEEGYSDIGFIKDLAKWQGAYNRITVENMSLGLNGKKLYAVSQNNSISHIINMLNTQDMDNETIRVLSEFGFNITDDEFGQGSIILKAIRNKKNQYILAHTYIGFKTDNTGDNGTEYSEEAFVDDYLAKMTMLQNGYLIFPTLSDKGTWMILSGVDIPGIQFSKVKDKLTVTNGPTVKWFDGEPYIVPADNVINLMIEYANTERLAIQQCMEDLGYENIPGYTKTGRKELPDSAKIINYHTKNKAGVQPNGTRFLSLTKIVVKEKENGKLVLKEYNLNDPNVSSEELLKLANEKFFDKPYEEQKEIMALTLAIQNKHAIEFAEKLGIIERENIEQTWKDLQGVEHTGKIQASKKSMMNLQTKHLNESQIEQLTAHFMRVLPSKEYGTWSAIPAGREKTFKFRVARSLAIAAILGDITNRSIISSQEVIRCFSGHPGMFKVDYDKSKGIIRDSAYDIQKRIGGLISTGDDNVTTLPGIKSYYVCAECKDYEVASTSDIASNLEEMFVDSSVRDIYGIKTGDWTTAYDRTISIDDLINNSDPNIKASLEKAKENGRIFANSFTGGINVADGASYITDEMCENMLRMRGAYDENVKKAFNILRSEETKYSWLNKKDAYEAIYNAVNIVTTKYSAYGFRSHTLNGDLMSNIAVPYYNKFALFPLFPCIATGRMKGIYDKMLQEEVDMLLMTSAVKVGSQGSVLFNGNEIKSPFNKYTQSYAYLRRQLNTDPEEGDKIKAGTQAMKIGLQNLRLGRTYTDSRTGNPILGRQLLDTYMNAINNLAAVGAKELSDMFFNEDGTEIDPEKLSKYLNDQLSSRNANKGTIEAIQVVTDPVTGEKKLTSPLSATSDASWIESIIISTVNKKIIDIITPGSSFVLRSVFAIEDKAGEGEGSIQSDKDLPISINGGKKLQMINNDGSMDAVISMDYFDDILFRGKMKNMSFEEKRKWLFDNNIIGNHEGVKANTIGTRIPTQAQSSVHALRFVDVIPAVKSTIILPEEFTKITGSDFDIDHLYLMSYNYNEFVNENGEETVSTQFDQQNEETASKYYQNTIIDCLMTLLKDSGNSISSLYKPIDNDTELITKVSDKIPESGSTKHEPFNFGTLHELVSRKNDYITGKTGIGPFALNAMNHIMTLLYGVSFKETMFTKETGICRLDNLIDYDDNNISAWLSGFINAHVDIVKDPYISRLNVNPYTYNMLSLLIRSGFGDISLWFVAQPIIRDISEASAQAKSQYARDPSKSKSTYQATEQAIEKAILKYLTAAEIDPKVIEKYVHSINKRDIQVRINTVNWLKDNKDVLEEIAKNPNATSVTVNGAEYNVKDVQKIVFYAWKTLEKYSKALGDLVQHTKIDTSKHGKSLIAINQYLDAYAKLVYPENEKSSLWDLKSIQRFVNHSWVDTKTKYAIMWPSRILSGLIFSANPQFLDAVIRFGNILSTTGGVLNVETLNLISRSLQTAIKSEYIIKYAKEKLGKTDKDIAALFVGPRSMNRRLTMLKNAIETNPNYNRLKNNNLISQIYSLINEEPIYVRGELKSKPEFITVLDNVDQSKVNSDLLIDGWTDLLNDEDKFVRSFARDLIVYSFLTSGEFKGWNKLFKYVPPAWIRGEIDTDYQSFSDYIQNALMSGTTEYNKYFDEIVSNNFMDYRLSRRVPELNEDGTRNFIDSSSIIKVGKAVEENEKSLVEKYITVRNAEYRGKGVAGYNLYKLAGFLPTANGYHPIYARIQKKGYHGKHSTDIYEYGWLFAYSENENDAFNQFDVELAFFNINQMLDEMAYDPNIKDYARVLSDAYLSREVEESSEVENNQSNADNIAELQSDNTVQDAVENAQNESQHFDSQEYGDGEEMNHCKH